LLALILLDIPRSKLPVPCYSLDTAWEISLDLRLSSQARPLGTRVLILRMLPFSFGGNFQLTENSHRMLAGYAVKLICIAALYIYMYLENKRRDREAIDGQEAEEEGVENGMLVSFEFHGA
jgi:hypothetical protein